MKAQNILYLYVLAWDRILTVDFDVQARICQYDVASRGIFVTYKAR